LTERPARTAHKACALGNVGSLRCDPVLAPHHYFLRYSFLPIRPKCDCGHRFSFSPSLSLATATSDLGPGHGTESREKVISQSHDEARAGNDLAALWLTALPIASAVAQGAPGQISAARAAALQECNRLAQRYPQHEWGNTQIHLYRTCMARHGQQE